MEPALCQLYRHTFVPYKLVNISSDAFSILYYVSVKTAAFVQFLLFSHCM